MISAPASAEYWERRYATGGFSGLGSVGEQGERKADYVNRFLGLWPVRVRSVLDIGSGDGNQASRLSAPGYLGVDPSPTAVRLARERCPDKDFTADREPPARDLHLSLDVLFHLIDDADFAEHLDLLFSAKRFAIVCASDRDERRAAHIRHRRWTHRVPRRWRQIDRTPLDALKSLYAFEADDG